MVLPVVVAETGLPMGLPATGFEGNGTVMEFIVTFCTAGALMGFPPASSNQHVALCADATLGMMAKTNSKASNHAQSKGA
jgi:hypothetical protein